MAFRQSNPEGLSPSTRSLVLSLGIGILGCSNVKPPSQAPTVEAEATVNTNLEPTAAEIESSASPESTQTPQPSAEYGDESNLNRVPPKDLLAGITARESQNILELLQEYLEVKQQEPDTTIEQSRIESLITAINLLVSPTTNDEKKAEWEAWMESDGRTDMVQMLEAATVLERYLEHATPAKKERAEKFREYAFAFHSLARTKYATLLLWVGALEAAQNPEAVYALGAKDRDGFFRSSLSDLPNRVGNHVVVLNACREDTVGGPLVSVEANGVVHWKDLEGNEQVFDPNEVCPKDTSVFVAPPSYVPPVVVPTPEVEEEPRVEESEPRDEEEKKEGPYGKFTLGYDHQWAAKVFGSEIIRGFRPNIGWIVLGIGGGGEKVSGGLEFGPRFVNGRDAAVNNIANGPEQWGFTARPHIDFKIIDKEWDKVQLEFGCGAGVLLSGGNGGFGAGADARCNVYVGNDTVGAVAGARVAAEKTGFSRGEDHDGHSTDLSVLSGGGQVGVEVHF